MDNKTKTKTWFKAVLKGDVSTVKALSEGTAADGGYLFPEILIGEIKLGELLERPFKRIISSLALPVMA